MPRIEGVAVYGRAGLHDVSVGPDGPVVDGRGLHLVPSFVDLACDPGFPGFPAREDRGSLFHAAVAGGFGDLVTSPATTPVVDTPEHLADMRRVAHEGVRRWPLAALTHGLEGKELSELGLMGLEGIAGASDGGRPVVDTVVLRNALEYAAAFGLRLFLRPAEPFLDALGHVHESAWAARLGLRGNPAAAEVIGVARVIALVAATRCPVHLQPLGTAEGVGLVRAARAAGLPVTAAVAARSLVLDEQALDDGLYDSRFHLHPPLRGAADREALVAGVRDGTLLVCADHQPRAPEEKELEFERAVPGSTGLESAFGAALTALGDLDLVVRALATGPRALLPQEHFGWTLVDPRASVVVDPSRHRSLARNDALAGRMLRGRVVGCWPEATLAPGGPAAGLPSAQ